MAGTPPLAEYPLIEIVDQAQQRANDLIEQAMGAATAAPLAMADRGDC